MNLKHILKILVILLASAALATSVACGEDDPGSTENQDNNQDEDVGNDADENNGTNNTNNKNNTNNDDPGWELAEETPTCEDSPAPDRCEDDAEGFDWSPASYVTELSVADEDCCVDFSRPGDTEYGNADNRLLQVIGLFSSRDEVNVSIQEGIDDGDVNIVLEYDGLEEIAADSEFNFPVNFLLAEEVTEDGALLNPDSFEEGAHPHALLPDARLIDEVPEGARYEEAPTSDLFLEAGPGTVLLNINLSAFLPGAEAQLELAISNASLVAEIVEPESSIDGGITLTNGQLGGFVYLEDLVNAVNSVGATCDCLDNPEKIADYNPDDGPSCAFEGNADDCTEDDGFCGELPGVCDYMPALKIAPDVDTNNNGTNEGISVGLLIEHAVATTITGVGEGLVVDE